MKTKMYDICIADYGMGNVFGLNMALKKIGLNSIITSDLNIMENSKALVLPGVGSFGSAMVNIKNKNIDSIIKNFHKKKKLIIGICLGMQLLFDESEENNCKEGLSILSGKIISLQKNKKLNIGWSKNYSDTKNEIAKMINLKKTYFIHSYAALPSDEKIILSRSKFNDKIFCSSVNHENVYGFQFHPEKSGNIGLSILKKITKKIK